MKRKKWKNRSSFQIAFLDVLSNSMIALLMVTLIQLQPNPVGAPTPGHYMLSITRLNPNANKGNIRVSVKLKDQAKFLNEAKQLSRSGMRWMSSWRHAKLLFVKQIPLNEIEELICHIDDPDFNQENETFLIQVELKGLSFSDQFILDKTNDRSILIIKDGKLVKPNNLL